MKTHEEKQEEQRAERVMKVKLFWLGAVFGASLFYALLLINRV